MEGLVVVKIRIIEKKKKATEHMSSIKNHISSPTVRLYSPKKNSETLELCILQHEILNILLQSSKPITEFIIFFVRITNS